MVADILLFKNINNNNAFKIPSYTNYLLNFGLHL